MVKPVKKRLATAPEPYPAYRTPPPYTNLTWGAKRQLGLSGPPSALKLRRIRQTTMLRRIPRLLLLLLWRLLPRCRNSGETNQRNLHAHSRTYNCGNSGIYGGNTNHASGAGKGVISRRNGRCIRRTGHWNAALPKTTVSDIVATTSAFTRVGLTTPAPTRHTVGYELYKRQDCGLRD